MNQLVNTFIESKRLKLSQIKCSRIHMGGGHDNCLILKVYDNDLKESGKNRYLGYIIELSGKVQATINNTNAKGNGIISEIPSISNEILFWKYRTEVAMKQREAMLVNGVI